MGLKIPEALSGEDREVLHRAHDGPGYEHFIYAGAPEPPLRPEDAAWARQFVLGTII